MYTIEKFIKLENKDVIFCLNFNKFENSIYGIKIKKFTLSLKVTKTGAQNNALKITQITWTFKNPTFSYLCCIVLDVHLNKRSQHENNSHQLFLSKYSI